MTYPPQEVELRRKAFPWVPGSDFDDALKEARDYNDKHPPLELVGTPTAQPAHPSHIERLERKKDTIEEINQNTEQLLLLEHREQLLLPFLKRLVPQEIAEEIVDKLVVTIRH